MNKELEALNKIAGITNYDGGKNLKALGNSHKKEFSLLESTLKDYEELIQKYNELLYNYQELVHCGLKSEQKKLKALEIIVDKLVDIRTFISSAILSKHETPDAYNFIVSDVRRYLTQEEFDLLKEIL